MHWRPRRQCGIFLDLPCQRSETSSKIVHMTHHRPSASDDKSQKPKKLGLFSKLIPPPAARALLLSTWVMLRSCFWPVILIYAAKDAAAFLLHRIGHRLTNLGEWGGGYCSAVFG